MDMNDNEHRLLDEFAMAALAGGLEQGVMDDAGYNFWHSPTTIANRAYGIAEAMLVRRQIAQRALLAARVASGIDE
jgi:hypothetical protein